MMNEDLYQFWFNSSLEPRAEWFLKDDAFDAEVRSRFAPRIESHLNSVPKTPRERLTLILLFDQVPRNAFRDDARSFAYDGYALALAKQSIRSGDLAGFSVTESLFVLLPLEHSEVLDDQRECVRHLEALVSSAPKALADFAAQILDFGRKHERIVARFGRFPHRNEILGRKSTGAELKFLKEPGSHF